MNIDGGFNAGSGGRPHQPETRIGWRPMALAGYFDQLSGLTADMLLAAMIDAGADPNALEAAMKSHHGVDCGIKVTEGRVAGNRVTYTWLSCAEASVPETCRAIPGGGADSPAAGSSEGDRPPWEGM